MTQARVHCKERLRRNCAVAIHVLTWGGGESMGLRSALLDRGRRRSPERVASSPEGAKRPDRRRKDRRGAKAAQSATLLPWYMIVLGVAVAASTNAAQQRAVAVLSDTGDNTDPLPEIAPDWIKESRRARRAWTLVNRVSNRIGHDNLTLVAAGIAFYAMFSIFPALGALV